MKWFRRGAHHQNGFRPTVDEIAANVKRTRWHVEGDDGGGWYFVSDCRVRFPVYGAKRGFIAIAPAGGIATLPVLFPEAVGVDA